MRPRTNGTQFVSTCFFMEPRQGRAIWRDGAEISSTWSTWTTSPRWQRETAGDPVDDVGKPETATSWSVEEVNGPFCPVEIDMVLVMM